MELWVRSQDKEVLMNVNHLYLSNNSIIGYCQSTFTSPILGTYKTKERALEVLDEIQKYLEKMGTNEILTDKVGIMNGIKHYGIIYQMPKD